ncbi:pentatricopeptide repeat-containing protein At2g13600-like [Cryptomeria japonica]|uniref:pentatricopeptide repeat-containing protein At2g13600-like n=1 Tax=Cryptomeria japonica TaxID=3369 RepID=UPI0027DA8E35|nr:pentatricopeptide repeat-containing protein At2g13600-like [Cryptomeria japonica]
MVSWNTIIAAYRRHGCPHEAVTLFHHMQQTGLQPDRITFASVLPACATIGALKQGLLDEGCTYFNHMSNAYCITPTVFHYVCMVDIIARAGYLEDTLNFIIKMPVKPVVVVWMSFLGACRSHMNIGLGVFTSTLLFDLDPKNAATYVLLSNMYAEVGRWGEVQMTDLFHRQEIVAKLENFAWEMKAVEYFPDSRPLLKSLEEKEI